MERVLHDPKLRKISDIHAKTSSVCTLNEHGMECTRVPDLSGAGGEAELVPLDEPEPVPTLPPPNNPPSYGGTELVTLPPKWEHEVWITIVCCILTIKAKMITYLSFCLHSSSRFHSLSNCQPTWKVSSSS